MSLEAIKNKLTPILSNYGIEYAGVFGSVSRGEDKENSDIDIMVRLGRPMGMFMFMGLVNEMESILGKKVDLITDKSLNKYLQPFVMKDLQTIYER